MQTLLIVWLYAAGIWFLAVAYWFSVQRVVTRVIVLSDFPAEVEAWLRSEGE